MISNRFYSPLFTCILLLIANCTANQQDNPKTPEPGSAEQIPLLQDAQTTDPERIAKGEMLYKQSCVFCHQADAIGKPGVAPSLTNDEFLALSTPQFLYMTIQEGRAGTGMPPFAHLDKEAITAIIAFLFSHAKTPSRAEAVWNQPKSKGDIAKGKTLFDQVCAGCHGPSGDGYRAGGTGTAIGKIGFLRHVADGFIRATIKEGRSNTRMRKFQGPEGLANLSDEEIDHIIAYLRTNPSK